MLTGSTSVKRPLATARFRMNALVTVFILGTLRVT